MTSAMLCSVLAIVAVGCSTDVESTSTSVPQTGASVPGATTVPASVDDTTGSAEASGTDTSAAAPDCASVVREAAFEIEIEDQVKMLDSALLVCPSVEELTVEIDKYPGFTGYTTDYLIVNRCRRVDDDAIRQAAVCSVAAPATTVVVEQEVDVIYVGKTLDGRQIELRPTPEVPFIDDTPAEIKKTVDIGVEQGCDATFDRRDFWYNIFVANGDDVASVYAQHAINMANLLDCGDRPLPNQPAGDATADAAGN